MLSRLVQLRKELVRFGLWLEVPFALDTTPSHIQLRYFLVSRLARILIGAIQFLVEIPVYFRNYPTTSFQLLARRDSNQSFLESYSEHLRRYQMAIVTVLASLLLLVAEIYISTRSLIVITKPTPAFAYSTTINLNPIWDRTSVKTDSISDDFMCTVLTTDYSCESASSTSLKVGLDNQAQDCDIGTPGTHYYYRSAMKFDLSSIPSGADITDVDLTVNVNTTTGEPVDIFRVDVGGGAPDNPEPTSCTDAGNSLYEKLANSSAYTTASNWNTGGSKTYDLTATADSDVEARIATSDLISIGIRVALSGQTAAIDSMEATDPILVVTYTLPPQAPTATNHSANTTTSITWTWTDNATVETRYDMHDGAHANVTGCANLAANSQSCTETGLSVNTQYTRHPNVTDAHGNTDGPAASAYTSIGAATGVSFSNVTDDAVTITADGSFANLGAGQSAVRIKNTNSLTNSGWITTTSWTETGLGSNTLNPYTAESRNGDGDTTNSPASENIYTLSTPPNVASTRSTSTWYTTANFPFTNNEPWGAGGVEYYRYAWDQVSTHVFAGTESTWSDVNANCPGGTCTTANTTLTQTASAAANNWYLHVQSFNGDDVANGSGTNYGPYFFDGTDPTAPATVNDGLGSDVDFTNSTTTLSANWTASSDATSGLQKYQYAIGTTPGGTQTLAYTDNGVSTSVTNAALTLANGQIYYVSVRAVDNAGNTGAATSSDGITVNTTAPSITDNQTGDTAPRNVAGTTYDVDFAKAATGPNLDYAQYQVWSAAGKSGSLIIDWTNIFTDDAASFTTNWPVNFVALQQGTNYVSVRVVALDSQAIEQTDVFSVLKDSVDPIISAIGVNPASTAVVVTWTTNESADSKVEYGLTAGYGNQVLSGSLVAGHNLTINGLTANTTYHYRIISQDAAGNAASTSNATFTTDSTDPAPAPSIVTTPTIENLEGGDIIVDPAQLITGTGPANAAIFIVTNGMINTVVLSDGQGNYSVRLRSPLSLGQHSIFVRARTAAGLVSEESEPIMVTLAPPGISVTILERIVRDGTHPSVTFKAVAPTGATVQVFLDDVLFKSIEAEPSDTPAFGFITDVTPNSSLAIGQHTIHFIAINRNGQTSLPTGHTAFSKTIGETGESLVFRTEVQYVVEAGDSLWSIAELFLGDGSRWDEIRQANLETFPSLATNPKLIYKGWALTIPPG